MTRNDEKGYALLALLLVLFVSGSSLMINTMNNRQSSATQAQLELARELTLAKESLLAYAANSASLNQNTRGPGFFPCPDMNSSDGNPTPAATCNADVPLVGRLPEYVDLATSRYRFSDKYSGIDEQFWLIVAPRYVYHSTNDDSQRRSNRRTHRTETYAAPFRMHLDGGGDYVAFLIAPGAALPTQDREGGPDNYANYLDGQNGASNFDFFSSYDVNPEAFNDHIIGITHNEYMVTVGTTVARQIMEGLENYHSIYSSYPPSSSVNTTFESQFNSNLTWLRRSTLGNGERWADTPNNVTWVRYADNDQGDLRFAGCSGITWFVNKDANTLTRSGANC
jgi:hypothetical protein